LTDDPEEARVTFALHSPDENLIPVLPNGRLFAHTLVLDDQTVFAEDVSELVAAVIPGYLDIDDRAAARELFCREIAVVIQAEELARAEEDGFELDTLDDDEKYAVSVERFEDEDDVDYAVWGHAVRLVLVSSDYAPYTRALPPEGRVLFLDPTSDESVIGSLVLAGIADWSTTTTRLRAQ
jgi:hypothetical protein